MKKIFRTAITIAVTTALGSTAALAQSQPNFTGFGVGANVSHINHSTSEDWLSHNLAKDGSEAALTASYGFAMGKDWVGTVGLSLGLMDSDFGSYGTYNIAARAKQHNSLSFAPGLRIGNSGLLYGKLAFHLLDVSYTDNVGFDRTKTHQGSGLGIGYAHALSPSLELSVEYEAVKFESWHVTTLDTAYPKQDTTSLGLTYRF